MKTIEHVRFRLTDLVRAVEQFRELKGIEDGPLGFTPKDALAYYWGWCQRRGWRLVAMSAQIDPSVASVRMEASGQLKIAAEEYWNVVVEGEDTDGGPDLIEEVADDAC